MSTLPLTNASSTEHPVSFAATGQALSLMIVSETLSSFQRFCIPFLDNKRFRIMAMPYSSSTEKNILEQSPDIVLCDTREAHLAQALDIARQISHRHPVILVTSPNQISLIHDLPYLSPSSPDDPLSSTTDPPVSASEAEADRLRLSQLTKRELEILKLTAAGHSMKQIATELHRAYGTVARHRANIMKKLELHDRVALTRFAIRQKLITI